MNRYAFFIRFQFRFYFFPYQCQYCALRIVFVIVLLVKPLWPLHSHDVARFKGTWKLKMTFRTFEEKNRRFVHFEVACSISFSTRCAASLLALLTDGNVELYFLKTSTWWMSNTLSWGYQLVAILLSDWETKSKIEDLSCKSNGVRTFRPISFQPLQLSSNHIITVTKCKYN